MLKRIFDSLTIFIFAVFAYMFLFNTLTLFVDYMLSGSLLNCIVAVPSCLFCGIYAIHCWRKK